MTRTWEFTDVEFKVLWDRLVGGHMPRPLSFLSTTMLMYDFDQEKYDTWQRLQSDIDPGLRTALGVLARPDVYLRLRAWNDRERDDAQRWVKARAARAGANGYVIRQLPGATPAHSGGFILTDCGPYGLTESILDMMPKVGPAKGGVIPLVTDKQPDQDPYASRASMVFEEADTGIARRSAEFFEVPADRTGTINILQNQSMFGSRGMHRDILVWRDLPDDGRYVIELPNENPTATPVSRTDLADKVDASIERMMSRVESHWEAST